MNISAVSCTPIKPRSFGQGIEEGQYEHVVSTVQRMNDEFVAPKHVEESEQQKKTNVKKPLAAIASVGLAGIVSFVSGKKIAAITSQIFKSAPEKIQKGLHAISDGMKSGATKLKKINPEHKIVGKIKAGNIGQKLGGFVENAEKTASKAYKKLAYIGIPNDAVPAEKAKKAMENMFGWTAVATMVPTVCAKDADEDGVKDILQHSQNVYTGQSSKMATAVDRANGVAKLVDLLT